jgi:hypothetical protein
MVRCTSYVNFMRTVFSLFLPSMFMPVSALRVPTGLVPGTNNNVQSIAHWYGNCPYVQHKGTSAVASVPASSVSFANLELSVVLFYLSVSVICNFA